MTHADQYSAEVLRLWRTGLPAKQIAAQFGVSVQRISQIKKRALAVEALSEVSRELSTRTRNALTGWDVELTPEAVSAAFKTLGELHRVPSLGRKGINELQTWLVHNGKPPVGKTEGTWPYFTKEQWFKLPLPLRQRWWTETQYGYLPASEELRTAVNAALAPTAA